MPQTVHGGAHQAGLVGVVMTETVILGGTGIVAAHSHRIGWQVAAGNAGGARLVRIVSHHGVGGVYAGRRVGHGYGGDGGTAFAQRVGTDARGQAGP